MYHLPLTLFYHVYAGSDGHINVDMEQQADNFLAFYIGGRQPMVNVLSFALLLTLQHPEVLARYTVILIILDLFQEGAGGGGNLLQLEVAILPP